MWKNQAEYRHVIWKHLNGSLAKFFAYVVIPKTCTEIMTLALFSTYYAIF